jgi:hypothetical protein
MFTGDIGKCQFCLACGSKPGRLGGGSRDCGKFEDKEAGWLGTSSSNQIGGVIDMSM